MVRLLGRGGFAEVYEVRDDDLHRRLAVKVLRDDIPWSSATLARFKQEARAIARLSHPNTLPIHFVGEADGLVFYVMPYCEGRTLTELLRGEGALSVRRALAIAEPILETLQHAHEHGLVHRDVKPDNILIENATGRPLLVDFGIVKYLDGPAGNTQTGFIVGTPLYMSPEQALGRGDVDARTDVYGMGVVLFQMLTGAPPFSGADSQEIVTRHLHDAVPVATLSRDRVPPWLSAVIVRCLAKHPDDRYPDARAVLGALREGKAAAPGTDALAMAPRGRRTRPRPPRCRERRDARPVAGASLVAVGLVAAAGALWASVHPRPEPTPPDAGPAVTHRSRRRRSWCTTASPSRSRSPTTIPASPSAPRTASASRSGRDRRSTPAGPWCGPPRATGACWARRSREASSGTRCETRSAARRSPWATDADGSRPPS